MDNLTAIGGRYYISLADPLGNPLRDIDDFLALSYVRSLNQVGVCQVVLGADFPLNLLKIDGRIGVYRTIRTNKTYLDTDTIYLIRKIERRIDTITITAFSPLYILGSPSGMSGRSVAYASGTAQTDKDGPSDDIMKGLVRENCVNFSGGRDVTTAVSGVDISSYLAVEENKGAGATIKKGVARRNLLRSLQSIAESTVTDTPRIYFDIISPNGVDMEFRTYKDLRGTDRTSTGPTFSDEDETLTDAVLTYDHTEEWTSAIVGGRGTGASRAIQTQQDTERIATSPLNYRERFQQGNYVITQSSATEQLQNEARASLREGRPLKVLTGTLVDTPQTQYGIHWLWGDKVPVSAFGEAFEAIIETVAITVYGNVETIEAFVRSE